ncbi:hypothetical protein H5410_004260, partial [Solanum commersonii]
RGQTGGPTLTCFIYLECKVLSRVLNDLFEYDQYVSYMNTSAQLVGLVDRYTGFTRGQFPLSYLGCPITHANKRKRDYNELISKVKKKLQS